MRYFKEDNSENLGRSNKRSIKIYNFLKTEIFCKKIPLILRNSKLLLMRLLREYASNSSFDDFDEWETVTNSYESFPENFKWDPKITSKLEVNNYFNFEGKN